MLSSLRRGGKGEKKKKKKAKGGSEGLTGLPWLVFFSPQSQREATTNNQIRVGQGNILNDSANLSKDGIFAM